MAEALFNRMTEERLRMYSLTTEEMRRVNEIIAELLREYKEDE